MGIREQDVNKWPRSVKSYFRDFIKKAGNNNLLALVGPGNYVDQKVSIYIVEPDIFSKFSIRIYSIVSSFKNNIDLRSCI